MSNLELPSDTELKAVKKASSALESDAKKLQESATEIQSAIDKMNKLSEAVEAHNSKIDEHNKEVSEKFSSAKSALDDIDKRQRIRQMKRLPARKILLAAVQLQRQKKKLNLPLIV